jgi:hypothetical protein
MEKYNSKYDMVLGALMLEQEEREKKIPSLLIMLGFL